MPRYHPYLLHTGLLLWLASWLVRAGFPPWTSFPGELLAFVGLGILALAVASTPTSPHQAHANTPPSLTALGLLLLGSMAWQGLAGTALVGDLWVAGAYTVATAIALHMGMALPHRERLFLALATTHVVGALLTATTMVLQWWFAEAAPYPIPPLPAGWRPSAYFDQPNHAATFLLGGTVAALYLRHIERLPTWAAWPLIALLSAGLQLANSRTAWLALVLITLLWAHKGRLLRPAATRLQTFQPLWGIWLVNVLMRLGLDHVLPLFSGPSALARTLEADPIRLGLWQQIGLGAMDRFWGGHGWLQTASAQYTGALQHTFRGSVGTNFAHNLVVDFAAWMGVPLAVLATLLLVRLAWLWVRRIEQPQQLFALAIALPFVVHCGLEYPYAYAYLLLPYAVYLGLAYTPTPHKGSAPASKVRAVWALLGWATLGLSVWTAQHYLALEEDIRLLRFLDRRINNTAAPEPNRYSPFDQLTLIKTALQNAPQPGMSASDMATLVQLRNRYCGAAYQARYVTALLLNQHAQQASTEYARFVAVHGAAMGQELNRILAEEHNFKLPWPVVLSSPASGF